MCSPEAVMRPFVTIAGDGLMAVPVVHDTHSYDMSSGKLLLAEEVPWDGATERLATRAELAHIRRELRCAILMRAVGLIPGAFHR
jgi:hypothetical protein